MEENENIIPEKNVEKKIMNGEDANPNETDNVNNIDEFLKIFSNKKEDRDASDIDALFNKINNHSREVNESTMKVAEQVAKSENEKREKREISRENSINKSKQKARRLKATIGTMMAIALTIGAVTVVKNVKENHSTMVADAYQQGIKDGATDMSAGNQKIVYDAGYNNGYEDGFEEGKITQIARISNQTDLKTFITLAGKLGKVTEAEYNKNPEAMFYALSNAQLDTLKKQIAVEYGLKSEDGIVINAERDPDDGKLNVTVFNNGDLITQIDDDTKLKITDYVENIQNNEGGELSYSQYGDAYKTYNETYENLLEEIDSDNGVKDTTDDDRDF